MILNKQTKYFILVITLLLITCSDKTSFSSKSPAASEKGEDNSSPVTDGGDGDDIIIDNPEGGDILTQISQFKAVKDTTVVDYLFIIDNSCSAGTLRDSSQKAMADTVKIEGLLPGSPLIATMTTSHGDKNDLSKRGPEMRGHDYIELEPGWLGFYTKSQLKGSCTHRRLPNPDTTTVSCRRVPISTSPRQTCSCRQSNG